MNKRRVNVKKHQRVMPDGRVLNVKRHNRSIELKRNRNAAGGHIAAQIAARGARTWPAAYASVRKWLLNAS